MSIEFRCSQCQRLLRTGDDTAGKQAQCPECGAITTIPSVAAAGFESVPAEPLSHEGATPEAADSPAPQPLPNEPAGRPYPQGGGYDPRFNPYGVDPQTVEAERAHAASRVTGPAIALMVLGVFGIVIYAASLIKLGVLGLDAVMPAELRKMPEVAAMPQESLVAGFVLGVSFSLVVNILLLLGGLSMKNLGSYAMAMVGVIIGLVPCMSPCCPLPLPFAIWALVVMCDPTVRRAFRR